MLELMSISSQVLYSQRKRSLLGMVELPPAITPGFNKVFEEVGQTVHISLPETAFAVVEDGISVPVSASIGREHQRVINQQDRDTISE
jgi:hypothetical protein